MLGALLIDSIINIPEYGPPLMFLKKRLKYLRSALSKEDEDCEIILADYIPKKLRILGTLNALYEHYFLCSKLLYHVVHIS